MEQEFNRKAFFNDFADLLVKHNVKNALIVYVGNGQVYNTTFNSEKGDAAKVLNEMSDVIDSYFDKIVL